jgi:hypothetical protein
MQGSAGKSTHTPNEGETVIHFKKEGDYFKLGLNLYRAPGGFVAMWVWFDFAKCETFWARLRLRLNRSPRILWSVERINIIENYIPKHDHIDAGQRKRENPYAI